MKQHYLIRMWADCLLVRCCGTAPVVSLSKFEVSMAVTGRWSNFDRPDPKMGVFLQSTEATPCGHLLK